ncbi:hypothetical protein [Sphingobacterium tabacisoli]|uniref:DUF4263 domain-containing protein n=1 Tax=Sphingobacterium tabacisoli TaxID=2044855 RepID=A0ABW5L4S6_9SPHI|nr:hypothetical protein [Sphingobacterium tabacisoli]
MKILLISEDSLLPPSYFKMFEGDYIESKNDVTVKYTVDSAKDFLTDIIIERQKHLDFIIIDYNSIQFEKEINTLTEWLRYTKELYSIKNFKLKAIPLFLMNNDLLISEDFFTQFQTQSDAPKYHNGIVEKPNDFSRIGISNNKLASGLDSWLDDLKSDLDDLDIDSEGKYLLDLKIFEKRFYKLRVLSNEFHRNSKRLDYIWVGNSTNIVEATGDDILKMLKQYERNPSLRNEKDVHDLLRSNEHLLKGEDYYHSLYEKHFYYPQNKRYVESDFINFKHDYSLAKDEIFEVKLPNERFITKTKIPRILKQAERYFNQVGKKYNSYFSSEVNKEEIAKRLKDEGIDTFSLDFSLSLLMGREEYRQENQELINKALLYGQKRVKLITYDNLIDRHQYLHQRVTRFGLN